MSHATNLVSAISHVCRILIVHKNLGISWIADGRHVTCYELRTWFLRYHTCSRSSLCTQTRVYQWIRKVTYRDLTRVPDPPCPHERGYINGYGRSHTATLVQPIYHRCGILIVHTNLGMSMVPVDPLSLDILRPGVWLCLFSNRWLLDTQVVFCWIADVRHVACHDLGSGMSIRHNIVVDVSFTVFPNLDVDT
jgi:hypothetical protein